MIDTNRLIIYKNFKYNDLFYGMSDVLNICMEWKENKEEVSDDAKDEVRTALYDYVNELIEVSVMYGLEGNLWHTFLAFLLANNENAYSVSCEIRGQITGSLNNIAENDFEIFKKLFEVDITLADRMLDVNCMEMITSYSNPHSESKKFNKRVRDDICGLASKLENCQDIHEFKDAVTDFYKHLGVGKFGLNKAFRLRLAEHESDNEIIPITNIEHIVLDDLVGYERQKQQLVENTEAFIQGKQANNVLLYGDSGTGKSSSIKAIVNQYYDRGLRLIEVYKHQFKALSELIEQIKDRNYKFIIYMDDLSFEEFEIEYKYLKAIIEGGLGKKPENVLIYATSNRRHLIRETYKDKSDRDEDMHTNDTVQEKLSLVARFGVTIGYFSPNKNDFQEIVRVLAKRNGITLDEDKLLLEANKWELAHGGFSGRTARQFITHLAGLE